MSRHTRREFVTLPLAGLALSIGTRAAGAIDSRVNGVVLGAQSYSFRDLPGVPGGSAVDAVVKAFVDTGLGDCELWAPHVEPAFDAAAGRGGAGRGGAPPAGEDARARLRSWRLQTPLDFFRDMRRRFDAAGVAIFAYNYSFDDSFTDGEIDRGFEMAKALGAEIITASTTIRVARRLAPFAAAHRMVVAMHGHSNTADPNEFATPESFATALKMSTYFKINLDIGHFTAANYDPVAFIREHHREITNLHLKDRRRNQGANVPWGHGDTPIREVLQLLKRERWPIRAYVEYEYSGRQSPIEEVKTCVAYARQALA